MPSKTGYNRKRRGGAREKQIGISPAPSLKRKSSGFDVTSLV